MRNVFMVAGGVTKFKKAYPEKSFRLMVKEAFDYIRDDLEITTGELIRLIDGTVCSYFSDHFAGQLKAGSMVQDFLGLCPKPSVRVEGGGATGGLCFQAAWEKIASGRFDACLAYGFETMSRVDTWKGNEFIALASDTNFDFPVGGFYTGYYAMMVQRHMHEFGTTVEQMARVSVKNHKNALYNPYAQQAAELTIKDVRASEMIAMPLTRLDVCAMSDGAAACLLTSEEGVKKIEKMRGRPIRPVKITGVGSGIDAMRMADRPHCSFDEFYKLYALSPEGSRETRRYYKELWKRGFRYPGVHSFRSGRMASKSAYKMANIADPYELSFIELHDAYTSSEMQTCEDMGLCRYGESGELMNGGSTFMPNIDYGLEFKRPQKRPFLPVNPSGGLLACGHPVGATGLMQAVFAFWQLQETIKEHFGDETLQVKNAKRGAIHSHAGTGTYVTVTIMEAA